MQRDRFYKWQAPNAKGVITLNPERNPHYNPGKQAAQLFTMIMQDLDDDCRKEFVYMWREFSELVANGNHHEAVALCQKIRDYAENGPDVNPS